jgi:coatomer subunit beta'
MAKFLELNNLKEFAFDITPDVDHKFELAISLNRIKESYEIASAENSADKLKKVGDIALMKGKFKVAEECFRKSEDPNSLFLLFSR